MPDSDIIDLPNARSVRAISTKVLDPSSHSYAIDPRRIYWRIKNYVDQLVAYSPSGPSDLALSAVKSKAIELGVRDRISPTQWLQLNRAVVYGKSHGVSVVITRIR